ncbi:AAA family ATPase [bacterium]|nr:AAA family ATPase [bacterium]
MKRISRSASIVAIKKALVAGYPLVGISSWEEDQVEAALAGLCKSLFNQTPCFFPWDLQNGLTRQGERIESTSKLEDALDWVQKQEGPGFFIFKDVSSFLPNPEVKRRLRNVAETFLGQNRFLFLLGTDFIIPSDFRKDIHLIEFGLPDISEIQEIFQRTINNCVKRGAEVRLSADQMTQAAVTLQGLTASEAQHGLNKVLWGQKVIDESIITNLHDEKEQFTRKEGILEYFRPQFDLKDLGGLQNLKEWLIKRKRLFTPEAASAGLTPPRGLLMMGISGCGKSLSVKIISSLWNLPLFRLDMNQVYSGVHGTPEAVFHYAIRTMESVSPAILWIDEIEAGISGSSVKEALPPPRTESTCFLPKLFERADLTKFSS